MEREGKGYVRVGRDAGWVVQRIVKGGCSDWGNFVYIHAGFLF